VIYLLVSGVVVGGSCGVLGVGALFTRGFRMVTGFASWWGWCLADFWR